MSGISGNGKKATTFDAWVLSMQSPHFNQAVSRWCPMKNSIEIQLIAVCSNIPFVRFSFFHFGFYAIFSTFIDVVAVIVAVDSLFSPFSPANNSKLSFNIVIIERWTNTIRVFFTHLKFSCVIVLVRYTFLFCISNARTVFIRMLSAKPHTSHHFLFDFSSVVPASIHASERRWVLLMLWERKRNRHTDGKWKGERDRDFVAHWEQTK